MDEAAFDKLPKRQQLAFALGVGSKLFGRDKMTRYVKQIAPLVRDRIGHGPDSGGETNYWKGVWRVYHAE